MDLSVSPSEPNMKHRDRKLTDTSTQPVDSDSDTEAALESLDAEIAHSSMKKKVQDAEPEEGFVKIYFDQYQFKSSTMLRITTNTTAQAVRVIAAQKAQLNVSDFEYSVLMMVNLCAGNQKTVRTIEDDEKILRLQRQGCPEPRRGSLIESLKLSRQHSNDSIKFIYKVRRIELDRVL